MAILHYATEGVSKLTTPGEVYFIQPEDGGLIKIGWAKCPTARLRQMQSHCPVKLRILHSSPGNGRDETRIHQLFSAHRKHGEWFEPVPDILSYISALASDTAPRKYIPADPVRPRTIGRRLAALRGI